ncbi:hypothetical protein G3I74_05255 [Wenzhouxiangella sp. C33]|uniref:Uncharacterized protein n=2 Tax=Wenzhouxiangella limi TaxID=2707351 RepID=A0A845V4H2_9GAMM|nr:hypothetical protein [Wenzhouxiangella limi]
MTSLRLRAGFVLFGLILMAAVASPAAAFKVTGSFTGWWDQPDEQNHGLIIAISRLPGGDQTAVVFWAHYNDSGSPTWLLAQGPLRDDTIEADLFQVRGVNFMQASGTRPDAEERIGTFEIVFENCDRGEVSYTTELPAVGAGGFAIQRLTTVPGMECSGGVSDNVPPSAPPEKFEIDLDPTPDYPDAQGEAEWVMRPGSAEFEIEIEDVQPGEYSVVVGGEERGTLVAVMDDDDDDWAEGELEFRSPQRGDKPLLDFDPRGQSIEVFLDGELVLSSDAPEEGTPVGEGKGPGFGGQEIEVEMTNSGVYSDGEASAELERERRLVSFEIEVEDIPVGEYPVWVDMTEVGVISVELDDDGDTEGELEFRFPLTAGYPLLDFDPRGSLIEIVEGDTTLFFVDFPSSGDDSNSDRPGHGGPGGKGPGPDLEIDFDLPNEGVYPDASAEAQYEIDEDGREFEVEIDDVPAGTYTLTVAGVERGDIVAVVDEDDDDGFNAEGKITFSDPRDSDDELLNFNVRGESIEILEGGTVIFSGTFPNR